jgi:hypothetical protein
MTELIEMRPDGNSRPAVDVLEDLDPDVYAAILDAAAARLAGQVSEPKPKRLRLPSGKTITAAAFGVLLVGIQGIVQAESWRGLTGFARLIHITGIATQGVPLTLDGVSTTAALLALKAELSDESSSRERAAMYVFTAMSCAANYWHGAVSGGIEGALYFAGMSLAVMFVFDLVLRQIRLAVRRQAGRRNRKMPQFGPTQWARYPRLTFLAWSLALANGIETPQEALAAARAELKRRAEADRAEAELAALAAMDLPVLPISADVLVGMTASHRLAVAFGVIGKTDIPAAVALLKQHGAPVDSSHAYKIRPQILEGAQS